MASHFTSQKGITQCGFSAEESATHSRLKERSAFNQSIMLLDGIVLLDKPSDITSNKALQIVKRLFSAEKAGHTGSLDPLATGMLPICLGEATKFSQYLLDADKTYRVEAILGVQTDTADAMGQMVASAAIPSNWQALLPACLSDFEGEIAQVPPMYSALKYQGQALYRLARKGVTVERSPRVVTIYRLAVCALTENTFTLEVHCSKGTYIRTLVEDIAQALGTLAHVSVLRRVQVGNFEEAAMYDLDGLREASVRTAAILPMEAMLPPAWPTLVLEQEAAERLKQGQSVSLVTADQLGLWALKLTSGAFIGLGEVTRIGEISPKRLISTKNLEKALCA